MPQAAVRGTSVGEHDELPRSAPGFQIEDFLEPDMAEGDAVEPRAGLRSLYTLSPAVKFQGQRRTGRSSINGVLPVRNAAALARCQ